MKCTFGVLVLLAACPRIGMDPRIGIIAPVCVNNEISVLGDMLSIRTVLRHNHGGGARDKLHFLQCCCPLNVCSIQ